MALPLVAGAAVAAFSYWSLKTGQPRPVPMPDDVRDARVEYGAPAQHSGALHPREPSAPLEVPRPVVGDHIPDPKFDAVASAQASVFPRFQRRVEIGKGADSTEAVAGAFLSGRSKADGVPSSIIVKAPGATRKSAFDSTDAQEAAAIMMRPRGRSSRSHRSKTTTTTTTTKTTTKAKQGKEGGSHWIEVALLVVAAAILLSRPRTVKKIKRVYNFATEEDSERAKQARAQAAAKRARARRSRKPARKSGAGSDSVQEEVVVLGQQPGDKGAAGDDDDASGGYDGDDGYDGAGAGAGSGDVTILRQSVHMWESRYAADTDSLRRQLQRVTAQLEQAQDAAQRWQQVADVAGDEGAVEGDDDGLDDADAEELRQRVRKLQRLVVMLRQQVMIVQSPGARLADSRLHSLDQKQLRRKMDETMALIKGEVITLDWPGIELVSRLVSEMGGGWQLHGDANQLKEDTFRECHRLLHLMVEDLEGDQEEGEPWVIDDMDAFLDKIEKDRYPDVFLTLQRLVVAYDTMGPTAKDDVSAREMVVNAGTLLEVARFTKYWVTRIHQHRTHYSSRFGAASGTMMTGSFVSGSSGDEAGRDAALQRLSAVVDASHRQSQVQDTTEVTESNETQDDGHGGVVTSHTVVTRHVAASNASLASGSSSYGQISSSDARGVSASGHSLQHPPVPDGDEA